MSNMTELKTPKKYLGWTVWVKMLVFVHIKANIKDWIGIKNIGIKSQTPPSMLWRLMNFSADQTRFPSAIKKKVHYVTVKKNNPHNLPV